MAKPIISPEEFISEVNKRLPSHPAYTPGMHAFLVPPGADGANASGYDWEPDGLATTGVVATIAAQVEAEFDVNPYISERLTVEPPEIHHACGRRAGARPLSDDGTAACA